MWEKDKFKRCISLILFAKCWLDLSNVFAYVWQSLTNWMNFIEFNRFDKKMAKVDRMFANVCRSNEKSCSLVVLLIWSPVTTCFHKFIDSAHFAGLSERPRVELELELSFSKRFLKAEQAEASA